MSNSRGGRPLHPPAAQIGFHRATPQEAAAVTSFLQRRGIMPQPCEADLAAFLRRADAALFCAMQGERIVGVAACERDGAVTRIVHLAIEPSQMNVLAAPLLSAVEDQARAQRAAMLAAWVARDSKECQHLQSLGYQADWEETEAVAGRLVTMVDLIKHV